MKILVVSEGRNELQGALVALVRRSLGRPDVEFETDEVKRQVGRIHGSGDRFARKVLMWVREAERRGFDALVLVVDRDGDPERQKQFAVAQDDTRLSLPRALGIAVETFDAWALADEVALSSVLSQSIQRQPDPESLRDAKTTCDDLIAKSDCGLGRSEVYARVASVVDLSVLAVRCPKGFGVFADRLQRLLQQDD